MNTSGLPTITITGVASDIELSGTVSQSDIMSGSGTQPDPYISSASTYEPTVSDLPTGYISYTSAPGSPQIIVEEVNGTNQITSFEFMDNNGVTYDTSSNLDTKFNGSASGGDNASIASSLIEFIKTSENSVQLELEKVYIYFKF